MTIQLLLIAALFAVVLALYIAGRLLVHLACAAVQAARRR